MPDVTVNAVPSNSSKEEDPAVITEPIPSVTILDSLKKQLQEKVKKPPLALAVPGRPGVALKFDTNITTEQINIWRKQAFNKQSENKFDTLRFACIVLANQNMEIIMNEQTALDDDGDPLKLRSREIWAMLGTDSSVPAVREMYGYDGHVISAGERVLEAAGYNSGDDEDEMDPTLTS